MSKMNKRKVKSPPKKESAIEGLDGQLMVIAAHRYCLGRRSYIVGNCIDWLCKWWPDLEEKTKNTIIRETLQALQENMAGDKYDFVAWKSFAEWAFKSMDDECKEWYKQSFKSLDDKCKEWYKQSSSHNILP